MGISKARNIIIGATTGLAATFLVADFASTATEADADRAALAMLTENPSRGLIGHRQTSADGSLKVEFYNVYDGSAVLAVDPGRYTCGMFNFYQNGILFEHGEDVGSVCVEKRFEPGI